MNNTFQENLHDHETILTKLGRESYTYFRGAPVFYIDNYFKPLAELCDELDDRYDDAANQIFKQAVDQNSFYCEFVNRIMKPESLYARDSQFLHKFGDIILDINNNWHIIELKTTRKSTNTFTINAESLHQFAKIPDEKKYYIHFLFYNYANDTFKMVGYNQLINASRFKLIYRAGVFPEYLAETILSSPIPKSNLAVKENDGLEVVDNPFLSSNIYYEFNLDEFNNSSLVSINQYIDSLSGMNSTGVNTQYNIVPPLNYGESNFTSGTI